MRSGILEREVCIYCRYIRVTNVFLTVSLKSFEPYIRSLKGQVVQLVLSFPSLDFLSFC